MTTPTQPTTDHAARAAKPFTVRRQDGSKQWAVYQGETLIEGGFFSKASAEECADEAAYDAVAGQSQHMACGEHRHA